MRHIISMLVENESGALSRIAGLFSARGYNIESLTVAPTDEPSLSRMTLVTSGNEDIVEQIKKQLNKLIDVVKLQDLAEGEHIEREMMLIKLKAAGANRDELMRLADIFRAKIIDVTDVSYVVELTGASKKLDAFIQAVPGGADHRGGPLRPHRYRPRRQGPDALRKERRVPGYELLARTLHESHAKARRREGSQVLGQIFRCDTFVRYGIVASVNFCPRNPFLSAFAPSRETFGLVTRHCYCLPQTIQQKQVLT